MKRKLIGIGSAVLIAATLLVLASCAGPGTAMPAAAPAFPIGGTEDVIHGMRVADPYRALEDSENPAVRAWTEQQNARTRAWLDQLPGRSRVSDRLVSLTRATSPFYNQLQARGAHVFALYHDQTKEQPLIVMLDGMADPLSRTVLIDLNRVDPTGHTAIDWYVASPDGTKLAVSLSRNGSEDGILHVYDVQTGREIEPPIPDVQYPTGGGSLAWAADGKAFWYTRYPGPSAPESERHFNQAVYLHRLGADTASDRLVLSGKDGLPRTAEVYLDNRSAAPAALAMVELGDGGQFQLWLLRPDASSEKLARYEDRVVAAAIAADGTVYAASRLNAPMGKVLRLEPPYRGGFERAQVVIEEASGAAIANAGEFEKPLTVAGTRLLVSRIAGGPSVVTAYDRDGGHATPLPLPPASAVREVVALPDGDVLYAVSSYLTPTYFARWNASTGASSRTELAVTSPVSFEDAEVVRLEATSKDGTHVPLNIIRKKGTVLNGANPTLLYGYGGYGVSLTPRFLGPYTRLWLDAGGVYAIANIRGGGEYGERWHKEGMLTKKQNVFDDFHAAAETLIELGYTSHSLLALKGASNGGLLMGAMITQHPELAQAVVSSVGIYDSLRAELDANGAFNVTEFGTVNEPEQFKALYAYSPYHHVAKGTQYPAVLLLTGANDNRVNPANSRKFAAALQAATSSDRPILLRTSDSGHGMGSSLSQWISEDTDELLFLFDQLRMPIPAGGS